MRIIAFDTETLLIRPALHAPPMVCLTWQVQGEEAQIAHWTEAEPILRGWLEDEDVLLVGQNVAYDMAVIGETFPNLRPLIFRAYDADRVTCTKLRAQLLDIAAGTFRRKHLGKGVFARQTYDLEALARRYAGMTLQKDAWRLSYEAFWDVPLSQWETRARGVQYRARIALSEVVAQRLQDPTNKELEKRAAGLQEMIASAPDQCRKYPLDDARATLAVYEAQEKHAVYLADQYRQARAYFWLHLSSCWGLRTDEVGVEILRRETEEAIAELEEELVNLGLVRADGSRDTKAAKRRMIEVCREAGTTIPRTATHGEGTKCTLLDGTKLPETPHGHPDCEDHVCLDADACDATEDDVLIGYAQYSQNRKVLSNDIEALLKGVHWPVHTSYGLAETGRTTSSKPNIQNVTKRPGMRESYIARPGKLFAQCDYPMLELYTLAQCCMSLFQESKLAEVINAGQDVHLWVAAKMLKMTYEEALAQRETPLVKRTRQLSKAFNFGRPGGMGDRKFVIATRKGVMNAARAKRLDPRAAWAELELNEARAKTLGAEWRATLTEMSLWFSRADSLKQTEDGRGSVESLFTKRHRGQATYCARCNTPFQGLASDCAKRAGWLLTRAMYVEETSPLFNCRIVAFIHDEFVVEVPDDERAHDAAVELGRLMVVGANEYLPDVPIPLAKMQPGGEASPLLMRRWSKNAAPKFDGNGRLVAWAA